MDTLLVPRIRFAALLLVCGWCTLPAQTLSINLTGAVVSGQALDGCALPAAQTNFATTGYQVWVNFTYVGALATDIGTLDWLDPSGNIYDSETIKQGVDGYGCLGYFIAIAEYPPGNTPGTWHVRLRWNGVEAFNIAFTISASAPASSFALIGAAVSGQPLNGCTLPTAQTSFLNTADQVWINFTYVDALAADVGTLDWLDPSDNVYDSETIKQGGDGYGCWGYFIAISGYGPANTLGTWHVRLRWNGVEAFNIAFTISAPGPPAFTWQGAGADTTVPFGGSPYCNYTETMSNLRLIVTADANRNIISAVLTGTSTEVGLNGCPFATIPQNNHTYTGSGAVSGSSISLQMNPAAANAPQAAASFDGQIVNNALFGTLTIKRTDIVGNLAWVVQSVVQAPAISCTYTVTPSSTSVTAAGGTGSFGVTASASSCAWTAASNASWITLTSVRNGIGNGTVGYSIAANAATSSRTSGIAVVGQSFTITQAAAAAGSSGSPQVITTIAGGDVVPPSGRVPALSLPLYYQWGIAADQSGNVYVADSQLNVVDRIAPDGTATVVAGTGLCAYAGDGGPARSASICSPRGIAVDRSGNLYIAELGNGVVRRVAADGTMSTIYRANTGGPYGVAADAAGIVYVSVDHRVYKIDSSGNAQLFAGTGSVGYSGDGGPATQAAVDPEGLAVDSSGNLYIADYLNNAVRMVDSSGIITSVIGNPAGGSYGEGVPAQNASVFAPYSIAFDRAGTLYISDSYNNRVRFLKNGLVRTLAGNFVGQYSGDGGPAASATLNNPVGITADPNGNVFIADAFNNVVRRVAPSGVITTYAGHAALTTPAPVPASNIRFDSPGDVAADQRGNVYVSDSGAHVVWRIGADGNAQIVAGNGLNQSNSGQPQAATSMSLWGAIAVDSAGLLYVGYGNQIFRVSASGQATVFAGNGAAATSGDGGPATQAAINNPRGMSFDPAGNLYVCETNGNRVRKISTDGTIHTVAGNGATNLTGDGGPATSTSIYLPRVVAADALGNIYFAETDGEHVGELKDARIRKITPDGIMRTIVGIPGQRGYCQDGTIATQCALGFVFGLAVDRNGTLYFSEDDTDRIRVIASDGSLKTIAGTAFRYAYSGDGGLATAASLAAPLAITFDSAGSLYIADSANRRIRKILANPPGIAVATASLSFSAQAGGAPAPSQNFAITADIAAVPFTITVDAPSWLNVNPASGQTPRLIEVTADPTSLTKNTYQATIRIQAPNATPSQLIVPVTFNVAASQPAQLQVDKTSLSFTFPKNGSVQTQSLAVANSGGGPLNFTATAQNAPGFRWLSVSPASATATPRAPVSLTVSADPTGLPPGTYTGTVTVNSSSGNAVVQVTMTISSLTQVILLSQRGLSFTAVAGGGIVPPQSFAVLNAGTGSASWTVSTSTLDGGNGWLRASPSSGVAAAGTASPGAISVSIDPSGLAPNSYYGLVRVDAPGAANTPQVVTVFLQVLPPGTSTGAVVQPASLVFTTSAGAESPGAQTVLLYNITANGKAFRSVTDSSSIQTLPANGTLDPQQPTPVIVQPFTGNLAAGTYSNTLTFQFSDGRVSRVNIKTIVSSSPKQAGFSSFARQDSGHPTAAGCSPTKLLPALASLPDSFEVSAGWPVALSALVRDDCGAPLASGSVTVSFSNGDPTLTLQPLADGRWEGTWPNHTTSVSKVTLKLHAESPQRNLIGDQQVAGGTASQQQPPIFDLAGVIAIFNGPAYAPVAPGSVISIYGDRLAESAAETNGATLSTQLVDTQVTMAGVKLPLYYVSQTQVNAIVPYVIGANAPQYLLVQRGLTYSTPVLVNVAPAEPSLLNAITDYPAGGSAPYIIAAASPAHSGDTLVLYCTGLGPVTPAATDGVPAVGTSKTDNTVQLSIGGVTARVDYSGLAPGFAGLYQVNTVVPPGVATGSAVPVALTVAGQTSPAVAIAIR
jgi:uncharacterized protein (TIGR03437 family)